MLLIPIRAAGATSLGNLPAPSWEHEGGRQAVQLLPPWLTAGHAPVSLTACSRAWKPHALEGNDQNDASYPMTPKPT